MDLQELTEKYDLKRVEDEEPEEEVIPIRLSEYCFCTGRQTKNLRVYMPIRSKKSSFLTQVFFGLGCPHCGRFQRNPEWRHKVLFARNK